MTDKELADLIAERDRLAHEYAIADEQLGRCHDLLCHARRLHIYRPLPGGLAQQIEDLLEAHNFHWELMTEDHTERKAA